VLLLTFLDYLDGSPWVKDFPFALVSPSAFFFVAIGPPKLALTGLTTIRLNDTMFVCLRLYVCLLVLGAVSSLNNSG
jgi:hypothetical protein